MTRPALMLAVALLAPVSAFAQDESAIAAEFRREKEAVAHSCGHLSFGAIPACGYSLLTANPLHVSLGSIAPGHGVALGPALVGHHTPNETWRITWSTDVVAAPGGAWRAGGYANFVQSSVSAPTPTFDEGDATDPRLDTYPVYSVYVQTVSLDRLSFFGLGPTSADDAQADWAMRQTVFGGGAVFPLRRAGRVGLALAGSVDGRVIAVEDGGDSGLPGISERFTAAEAPGMGDRRTYIRVSGGVRLNPTLWTHVRPSYRLDVERFAGGPDRRFLRWTVDLAHELPFYRTFRPMPREGNTPNDCSASVSDHVCPSPSRNRYGALSFRVLAVGSRPGDDAEVPFYFQPTLGGADINHAKWLTSFADDRFRATNLLAMQVTVEHTLVDVPMPRDFSLPLGAIVTVEQGRVAQDWGSSRFQRSYAAGLTIRAGGFPEVFLLMAWGGGHERVVGSINPALLGGSPRPSLH